MEQSIGFNVAGVTHHAFSSRAEGFCLLNDQAIAARWLIENSSIEKLLIIDLDVHQGNGTAEIFQNEPAVFTFSGEVANGLAASEFNGEEIDFAQKHIRILSGLYGLLKPLDLIQPYRLEMGTAWAPAKNKNLYAFWDKLITEQINKDLNGSETVINLASVEYFKAVQQKVLKANVIHCHFKEKKGKDYKIVMMFAKKARGRMAHYIVKNKIEKSSDLQKFKLDDYAFNKTLSTANDWVFTRG